MRFIKLGLFSLVFFFVLLTGIASLLPSYINISRAIDINAPADTIYNYISNMQNWNKWYGNNNNPVKVLSAITNGRGAAVAVNNTTITIQSVEPGKTIKALWQHNKGTPLTGFFNLVRKTASQTTLQWHFTQHLKWYPWQRLAAVVANKTTTPFMEQSLERLKKNIENPE